MGILDQRAKEKANEKMKKGDREDDMCKRCIISPQIYPYKDLIVSVRFYNCRHVGN